MLLRLIEEYQLLQVTFHDHAREWFVCMQTYLRRREFSNYFVLHRTQTLLETYRHCEPAEPLDLLVASWCQCHFAPELIVGHRT
jgi:hypothetical protein